MIAVKNKRPRHFQLTQPDAHFLLGLNASLTAAEWRVWLYLVTLDPFGDVGAKFDAEELMYFCNIQKSTYFAAKAKFIKLGLFEFVEGTTKVRNLNGSKAKIDSEISNFRSEASEPRSEISNFRSEVSEPHSEISESQTPELKPVLESESLHTLSDIIQTLSLNPPTTLRQEIENLDLEIQENKNQLIESEQELIVNDPLPLEKIDRDLDKKELEINNQRSITTNPLTPKQTGEDPVQVPPPPAAPEFSFLEWVKYYKAKDARNPQGYAQTCIRRDDGSLMAEYERWLASRKEPVFSLYAPEPNVVPPLEERPSIMANVREILRSRGLNL
jgi:hypothetical protein